MSNFAERLQLALKMRDIKPIDLARMTGVNKSYISRYISGSYEAKQQNIYKLAKALNVSEIWLMGISDEINQPSTNSRIVKPEPFTAQIPLYALISCGSAMFVGDNVEEYITLPVSLLHQNKEYFAQYAKGDSMIDENIQDGDLLVFEKTTIVQNGQIGCFCIDENMATCKKFFKDDASAIITLQPANKTYAPIIVTIETMNFHVVGKLALVINKRG